MAKSFELKGTLWFIGQTEQVTDSLTKRVAWVRIDEDTEYPQIVEVEFIKDKCDLLNKYNSGDKVTVDVNLRGRIVEKDGKKRCYNSINAYRIAGLATGTPSAAANSQPIPSSGSPLPFSAPQPGK